MMVVVMLVVIMMVTVMGEALAGSAEQSSGPAGPLSVLHPWPQPLLLLPGTTSEHWPFPCTIRLGAQQAWSSLWALVSSVLSGSFSPRSPPAVSFF